jgi:hypothetical protein
MNLKVPINYIVLTLLLFFIGAGTVSSQTPDYNIPQQAIFEEMGTNLWVGSYNKFRFAERWLWDAQHHYRRAGYNGVPYVGRMSQFYNRHAVTYIVDKSFNVTAGGVLRLNFTPEPGNPDFNKITYEPRFWHEYMFIMPYPKFMLYHRIRIEHRWSQANLKGADWVYRNRWRYKIFAFIPINKPRLEPGAWYFIPDVEIIMQSGRAVVDSPLEDLRIYPQIGYIVNPRLKIGGGPMYTTGQRLSGGFTYRQRMILRVNAYVSLDFRKFEKKLPDINLTD